MIVSSLSGNPLSSVADAKTGMWRSNRTSSDTGPAEHASQGGNAPAREQSQHSETTNPVRFGAAGIPALFAPDTGTVAANKTEAAGGAGSDDGSSAQRAERMKYLVDTMRGASSQSQQVAQDGAEKVATDQFRRAMAAYGDNSG